MGMDRDVRIAQPAGGFPIRHPRPQAFGHGRRSAFGAGFQPRDGLLRPGEGDQQGMPVIGLWAPPWRPRRAGRFEIIGLGFPGRLEPVFVLFFGSSDILRQNYKVLIRLHHRPVLERKPSFRSASATGQKTEQEALRTTL